MSKYTLKFEEPIKKIESQIKDLKENSNKTGIDVTDKIKILEKELHDTCESIYNNLSRWQKVELARHPARPHTSDYLKLISNNWFELHGDRKYSDDPSIISGICNIDNKSYILIGHEKGKTTKNKLYHNFGMAKPEGYRKALRVMKLAEKFKIRLIKNGFQQLRQGKI